jgi:hypothetical protein
MRLDTVDRDAKGCRHLRLRHVDEVTENYDLALALRKARENATQLKPL